MKRIGYLLTEETVTLDACKLAILRAARGKHRRVSVRKTLAQLDRATERLRDLVLTGAYQPSPYIKCDIIDQPSGKQRVLHKPRFFPDQCVHHLIISLMGNALMRRLDPYCIASIPSRGTHYGHRAIRRWLQQDKRGTKYCLKCDVKKCYDNIRPAVVVASIARFVKDKKFLQLISKVAYSHPTLPLGNYTSGWFQNILMAVVDRLVRAYKATSHYLRYVDDFIVLSGNKRKLHALVPFIKEWLAKIGLTLKENWQVFPVDVRGIDMLGYRFFRKYTLMRKRNVLAIMRMVRDYLRSPTPFRSRSLLSRVGQCRWFSSYNFWQKYCAKLNFKRMKRRAYP